MTPVQVEAARGLLEWGIQEVAARSRTTYDQVTTYNNSGRVAVTYCRLSWADPLPAIRAALGEAGIEFTDGDMTGTRLQKPAGVA